MSREGDQSQSHLQDGREEDPMLESKVSICSPVFARRLKTGTGVHSWFTFWILCPQEGKSPIPEQQQIGVFLWPPKHHPLLDELLKLFSRSFQMSRTKLYTVPMAVISCSFLASESLLKGYPSLISEKDRSRCDT